MARNTRQIQQPKPDWRDKRIAELEDENAELRARLATVTAFTAHGLEGVSQIVKQAQQERDAALTQLDIGAREIMRFYESAWAIYQGCAEHYTAYQNTAAKLLEDENAPQLYTAMVLIADAAEEAAVDVFNTLVMPDENAPLNLSALLIAAARLRETAARYDQNRMILGAAMGWSNNPGLVCDELCRALRTTGTVDLKHLERLGVGWFRTELALERAPGSLAKIKEWLDLSEAYQRSGETQEAFAAENAYCDPKTLARALRLREAIEDKARGKPELFGNGPFLVRDSA